MSQQRRNTFHRAKSEWRRHVHDLTIQVDSISERHNQGKRIGMGQLYEVAHAIAKVGGKGEALRGRMDDYDVIKRDRVHESIAASCRLLETASGILQLIAEKQGLPLVDFPAYTSELAVTSDIETGAVEAFEQLRKELEG